MDYRNCDKLALLTGHDWRPMYPDEISHGFHPGETLCAISPYRGWLHPDGNQPFYIPAQYAPVADPQFFLEHFVNRKYGLVSMLPSVRFEFEGDETPVGAFSVALFTITGSINLTGSLTLTNINSLAKNTNIALTSHGVSWQAKEVLGNILNGLSISSASDSPPQISLHSSILGTTWQCQANWQPPEITATVSNQYINAQIDDWLIEGELGGKFTGRITPENPASAVAGEVEAAFEKFVHQSENRALALRELIQFNLVGSWAEVAGDPKAPPAVRAALGLLIIVDEAAAKAALLS
jgi:hypothetical protein